MVTRSWRGPAPGRPAVPLPPGRLPLVRGGRPLKRWTYVGADGPDLMLCAACGRIGVVPSSWWAAWDGERLHDGRRRPFELEVDGGADIEVVSPHGRQYAWTRKRAARVRGTFAGRLDLAGIVDESAGYHARHTSWRWSAGVGNACPRRWNLVEGIHDAPELSERTVWVAGEQGEVPPVAFDDLRGVAGLRFERVATRARRENHLLIRSDYEQPFGRFEGELPGVGPLRAGWA